MSDMTYDEAVRRLGLEAGASSSAIKARYGELARKLHPDTGRSTASDKLMAKLNVAREVALRGPSPATAGGKTSHQAGRTTGQQLVPVSVISEVVRAQQQALTRTEERRRTSADATRAIVRHETTRLVRIKRLATAAAGVAAGATALTAVIRAVAVPGISDAGSNEMEVVIIVFGVVAASAGAVAWVFNMRAQSVEHLVEDATDALGDRATYLAIITEIVRSSGRALPWKAHDLRSAVSKWVNEIGYRERDSVAALAQRVGVPDFTRLLVAKGAELEVLEESVVSADGTPVVEYQLTIGLAR